MAQISQFLTHLNSLEHLSQPLVSGLSNYLRHFKDTSAPITHSEINSFVDLCLGHVFWQKNKADFEKHLTAILKSFSDQYQHDFSGTIHLPGQIQQLQIGNSKEFLKSVEQFAEKTKTTNEAFRVLEVGPDQALVLFRLANKGLRVQQIFNHFTIREGQLRPLNCENSIEYDQNLRLQPNLFHQFAISSHSTAVLFGEKNGVVVRGYSHAVFQRLEDEDFHKNRHFLFPLKKIEAHFVNKNSDPFYRRLIEDLERSARRLRLGDKNALSHAETVIARATLIQQHVYPHEKMLRLLIQDLRQKVGLEDTNGLHPTQ